MYSIFCTDLGGPSLPSVDAFYGYQEKDQTLGGGKERPSVISVGFVFGLDGRFVEVPSQGGRHVASAEIQGPSHLLC